MEDRNESKGVDRKEFSALLRNKMILSVAIRSCIREAASMDPRAICDCLELEEDGMTVKNVELDDPSGQYEGMLDNVYRLRIPGKSEILVVFNKG